MKKIKNKPQLNGVAPLVAVAKTGLARSPAMYLIQLRTNLGRGKTALHEAIQIVGKALPLPGPIKKP